MSSKNWSSNQSVFSPLEKIASTDDELQIAAEQKNDSAQQQQQQPGQFDVWCSILDQKPSSLPPPYVHPLVKKSKSCLTLKSLEICTENLGSESGSDSYPPSDISLSDIEEQQEEIQAEEATEQQVVVVQEKKELVVMNYSKKSSRPPLAAPRSFPPPLNSLSRPGGGGIQMKTHRKEGRLVLEAVPVATSQNCFSAQRQHGRLVLTFTSPIPESKSFENEDVFETDEEVKFEGGRDGEIVKDQDEEPILEEEEEEEDKGVVLEMTSTRVPKLQPTGVINVHRSASMVNKFTGLTNNMNDTTWSLSSKYNKLDRMINLGEVLPQSLPIISPPTLLAAGKAPPTKLSQQTVAAAAAVEANRYEYCWRKETSPKVSSVGGIYHSLNQQSLPNTKITYRNNNNNNYYSNSNSNNLFVKDSITTTTKGGKDYKEEKQNGEKVVEHLIVPAYCKPEPRRSLVFWEPHCIATS
ncbi:hypothetical protein MKW94_003551 [Papaver nudicaule]|uniref:FAF domain-containing protein n=1 Tax=Papaver nudicaule TaxID=74823 RepID=A0AA42AWK9_PAPNU|nr:hypothetical protein [Papaver nudicaule]